MRPWVLRLGSIAQGGGRTRPSGPPSPAFSPSFKSNYEIPWPWCARTNIRAPATPRFRSRSSNWIGKKLVLGKARWSKKYNAPKAREGRAA